MTLKTDWTMHLQTAFSICHWTYHLRFKTNAENSHNTGLKSLNDKSKLEETARPVWTNESIYGPAKSDKNVQSKSTFHSGSADYQQMDPMREQKRDIYDQMSMSNRQLVNGQEQVPQMRRSVVTIRNNTNKSKQFKQQTANYQQRPQVQRDWLDSKHRSLYVKPSDYECAADMPGLKSTTSDYLLNSETLYRNEIRKSIKNVMQQKQPQQQQQQQSVSNSQNGITLPIFNQKHNSFNPILDYENPKTLMEPFFYTNNIDQKCKYQGLGNSIKNPSTGNYLTTTVPQVYNSTASNSVAINQSKNNHQKGPVITKIVSNANPKCDSMNSNKEMSASKNLTRSMIYLERPSNSSNEYESRV